MWVTRESMLTGKTHSMELDVTPEDIWRYFHESILLQDAFPSLSPDEREFIKSGITPEEWERYMR